jgi:hypothetical protein
MSSRPHRPVHYVDELHAHAVLKLTLLITALAVML